LASTTQAIADPIGPGSFDEEPDVPLALLIRANGREYGFEVDRLREVVPFRRITRLPGAPPFVRGLINLRGTVVTVIDLSLRLGGEAVIPRTGSIVLVEYGERVVGLAVDAVLDVQPLTSGVQPPPQNGGDSNAGLTRGIARLGRQLVVMLDTEALARDVLISSRGIGN
jgi:purine-binding chemotaxis protein CheW